MKKKVIYIVIAIILILNITWLIFNIYNTSLIKSKIKQEDNILKLNGENFIKLNINDKYEEKGVTSKEKVLIEGNVDTTKIGKYLIRYYIKNNRINNYNLYRIVQVIDEEPPVLKLNGNSTVNLYVGETYKEKGVTVTDNSQDDLKDKIKIEGVVNTKKVGKYTIKYSVTDKSGNTSSITRKINVKNRPITTKRVINKVTKNEKGDKDDKKVDLNKNANTIISMNFTDNGIYIKGYVKNKSDKYLIKLCDSSCINYNMIAKENNYEGGIELKSIKNGTYKMKLQTDIEMDVINELAEFNKIMRAKIGDKLVTFNYPNNVPTIKIEDFNYEYDILIDAGHGGSDPGAVNSEIKEKDLNLTQSLYEKKRYEEHGLKVKMIRTDDTYGLMMGSSKEARVHRRAYAMGYYGVVSKYVYSNHHNSINNDYYSGYEIILANNAFKTKYSTAYKIASIWKEKYPLLEDHLRIYGRNFDTDILLDKTNGETYNIRNYYAVIRIPYELFNVYTTIYEGCYLSNKDDYNWYKENYRKLSEIKIKAYVESLGITYKEVSLDETN